MRMRLGKGKEGNGKGKEGKGPRRSFEENHAHHQSANRGEPCQGLWLSPPTSAARLAGGRRYRTDPAGLRGKWGNEA